MWNLYRLFIIRKKKSRYHFVGIILAKEGAIDRINKETEVRAARHRNRLLRFDSKHLMPSFSYKVAIGSFKRRKKKEEAAGGILRGPEESRDSSLLCRIGRVKLIFFRPILLHGQPLLLKPFNKSTENNFLLTGVKLNY